MNPLATPGVDASERKEKRCSIFDANDARALRSKAFIVPNDNRDNKVSVNDAFSNDSDDRTPSDHLTRSQRMVKLNNPYD